MAYYRARPPMKQQGLPDSCWAAALESFSRVTRGVPVLAEPNLVARYGKGETGGLSLTGLAALRLELFFYGARIDHVAQPHMPYDVEDKLRCSHVVLARQLGGKDSTDWHAWLVYGIDNWVLYMEPRDGSRRKMRWVSGDFASANGYYMFWKA